MQCCTPSTERLKVKEGTLRLDVASGKISGRIVVDVKSGNTGDGEHDRSMHQDVLESARFPEAVFSPNRLTGQLALEGQSEVGVRGVLRIHGQDHDVTLPAKVSVENSRFTATSHLSIPYVKWGMKDPSTFLLHVNETVEVEMRVAGTIREDSLVIFDLRSNLVASGEPFSLNDERIAFRRREHVQRFGLLALKPV